jgi:DNA repair exonuclease SbcCD ATPase subunit
MRIKRLQLETFRKHANSLLTFGDAALIVIRGKNFAGKSTVGQAISMCLTPSTTGLDGLGRGFITKIKRGCAKAVITADIQGKHHLIQRVVTLNTNATGRTQRSYCLDDPQWNPVNFDREIEDNRAALTIALNTDAFWRMDEKEQKNLLARLALPTRYEFDSRVVTAVDDALGQGQINFGGEPFAVINRAYTKLFDERQIANRQVKEFSMPEPLSGPARSSELEEKLNALREERRTRLQERDKAVADATAHELGRVRVRSRIDTLEEAARKEQTKADTVRAKLQPEEALASVRKLAQGKDEMVRLEKLRDEQVLLGRNNNTLIAQLERAFRGGKCPTCGHMIDEAGLAAAKESAARQAFDQQGALTQIEQRMRALGDVGAAIELIAGHEKALKELATAESAIATKRGQLEQEKSELPEEMQFDFQPYDRPLAECDAEIEKVSALLRPAIAAEERAKEIEVKSQQITALKSRASLLDRLVKYFDKDGIKATLLKQYVGGFETKINETLSAWNYSCALCIEPYQFDITNAAEDVVPIGELSGAERVMFSLAFQCAVSRTANIGLVVIDEVNTLLPELRAILNKRMYEMVQHGYLEQVILIVADTSEIIPKLPHSAFFMVNQGEVVKL